MTNFENWKAKKDFEAMQEEFADLLAWGDCHCCPAKVSCSEGDRRLCSDLEKLAEWADSEVSYES